MSPIVLIHIVIIVVGLIFLGVVLRSKKSSTSQEDGEQSMVSEEGPKSKPTKHQCRRYIEFRFIPELLSIFEEEPRENAAIILSNRDRLKSLMDSGIEFDWDEVSFRSTHIDYRRILICYKFPPPEQIPEAILGAVVLNIESCKGCYYTLEVSFGGKCVLGSIVVDRDGNESHYNHGILEDPSIASFMEWCKKQSSKNSDLQ